MTICFGKDPYPRNEAIDVQHYVFGIELNDSTNRISGKASITILFRKSVDFFELDLVERGTRGFGMDVARVMSSNRNLEFTHQKGRLRINNGTPPNAGEIRTYEISHAGIPEEGLVIGKNKFGDRSFFGDNWPDRGHHWLPCIDHPSDKATVEFAISAPEKYQVVASGKLHEETNLPKGMKLTRYIATAPIGVKVMTIGVARFAVEQTAEVDHIPQSIWVYPQNRDAGFNDFAVGVKIFEFYHRNIGPYAFEKLAHVQSKTKWGGLENAGNIFYTEGSVTGKNQHEGLIAHETAHQWFGNSVTENDWHHVWLSEGFATYFAALYDEQAYGPEKLADDMRESREEVIEFTLTSKAPIVDTTITNIDKVLSTNTYQKAAWVLHMLRQEIGDEPFWKGIRNYYATYKNKNVLTVDFQKIMETASGSDLKKFFDQWLYRGGHPKLAMTWTYKKGTLSITLNQKQAQAFEFPLDILIQLDPKTTITKNFRVKGGTEHLTVVITGKPLGITLDPATRLLFEVVK
jgi:aminopeptidase N